MGAFVQHFQHGQAQQVLQPQQGVECIPQQYCVRLWVSLAPIIRAAVRPRVLCVPAMLCGRSSHLRAVQVLTCISYRSCRRAADDEGNLRGLSVCSDGSSGPRLRPSTSAQMHEWVETQIAATAIGRNEPQPCSGVIAAPPGNTGHRDRPTLLKPMGAAHLLPGKATDCSVTAHPS